MKREEFKDIAIEVLPHINAIAEVLERNDVSSLASITTDKSGYFRFSVNGTGLELSRLNSNEAAYITSYEKLEDGIDEGE